MIYLDTSVVLSFLLNEERRLLMRAWVVAQPESTLIVSDWTSTEVVGALASKQRRRLIDQESRLGAIEVYRQLLDTILIERAVPRDAYRRAARYMDMPDNGLRSADALHLGVAGSLGMALATLDENLAAAARLFDIPLADLA